VITVHTWKCNQHYVNKLIFFKVVYIHIYKRISDTPSDTNK